MRKYEFTDETKELTDGTVLHRIRAVRDFECVKAGDLGGWIEKEDNLSHGGTAWVSGGARVYGNAWVFGNAWVRGDAKVGGKAAISKTSHYLVIGPIGSRDDFTTFYRDAKGRICVACGCFSGTLDEFLKKARETHGDDRHGRRYRAAAELAKMQIEGVSQ